MKRRLLWLSHVIPYPPKAGVLLRSYWLLRELSKNFDIDLIAFNQRALMRTFFSDEKEGRQCSMDALAEFLKVVEVCDLPGDVSRVRGLYDLIAGAIFRKPYSVRWFNSDNYCKAVEVAARNGKYDLIHVDTEGLIPMVPRAYSGPITVDHHNVESHMMLRRSVAEESIFRKLYFRSEASKLRKFEREWLHRFASNIVCSEDDAARLREVVKGVSPYVAPNGMAFPEAVPVRDIANTDVKLLFVGGLSWYPNRDAMVHFLTEIWPDLIQAFPSISIDIVGRSPPAVLVGLAERMSGVRLHGYVDDISVFFNSACLFVCPIRDGGGTKLKMIDAAMRGLPIVCHPIANEGLGFRHGIDVALAETPAEYVQAIAALKENPAAFVEMAASAFKQAKERFSAEAIGLNLANHLNEKIDEYKILKKHKAGIQ